MASGRRPSAVVALLLFLVSELWPQSASSVERSIVVLLDVSYSMGLSPSGARERHIDVAARAAREIARRSVSGEEWALVVTGDRSTVRVLTPFTSDATALAWRRLPSPEGTTPLAEALARATDYLLSEGRGAQKRLVLLTDGIATDGTYRLPNPEYFRVRGVPVTSVICRVPDMESVQSELETFATRTGGAAYEAGRLARDGYVTLLRGLRGNLDGRAGGDIEAGLPLPEGVRVTAAAGGAPAARVSARVAMPVVETATAMPRPSSAVVEGARLTFRPIWLGIPVLALALWRLSRRIGALLRATGSARGGVSYRQILHLDVRSARGGSGRVLLRAMPAVIGSSASADLRLESTPGLRPRPDFRIEALADGLHLRSPKPLHINGVAKTHKVLRPGDCVAYDGHRVVFRELATERVLVRAPSADVGFPWELVVVGVVLLGGLLFWRPVTVTLRPRAVAGAASVAVPSLSVLAPPDEGGPAPRRPFVGARGAAGGAVLASAVSVPGEPRTADADVPLYADEEPAGTRSVVTMYAPGEAIPYASADALFVHAHPDDESIDFGVLLARLSASGRRVVVALLTDGEAGIDQYPDRASGGLYPPRDMWPAELAAVRPAEAREALAELGVQAYVRLGLRNHPYASSRQVLSHAALMADWGGEEAVIRRLVEIIEGFRPTLVVSPDSAHGGAHEHFEHAGAGYLVREALRQVRQRGRHAPAAYLRSVDPRFVGTYAGVERVDALDGRVGAGGTLRAAQVRALERHRTQRDATVVAVETLASQRWEYYVSTFWGEPSTLEGLLRTW